MTTWPKAREFYWYMLTVYTAIRVARTHVYKAETCYSLHHNLRCKAAADAHIYSRYADTHVTFYSRDILHLTPQSALQECTCIKQRQATVYTGIRVARIHVYTAETCLELTPEPALQECTCIQQRKAKKLTAESALYSRKKANSLHRNPRCMVHVYTAETRYGLHRNPRYTAEKG